MQTPLRGFAFTTGNHQNIPASLREAFSPMKRKIEIEKNLHSQVRHLQKSGSFQAEGCTVARRLFINKPLEGDYFSTSLRVLGDGLGRGGKFSTTGYLHRPTRESRFFPIANDVINEEEQNTGGHGNLEVGAIPIGIYNLNCTKQSIPNRGPTTPIALKDLLSRTGRSTTRRPSISGIFRGRKPSLTNIKPSKSSNRGPMEVTLMQDTNLRVALPTGSLLLPNTSGRESAYVPPSGSSGGSSGGCVVNTPTISKLKHRITMPLRPDIPSRKRFKPPLLGNKANVLLDNDFGKTRATASRSRARPFGKRGELVMESPKIDIKRIASFAAVREAW